VGRTFLGSSNVGAISTRKRSEVRNKREEKSAVGTLTFGKANRIHERDVNCGGETDQLLRG
jgi:predicted transcriptional regulator